MPDIVAGAQIFDLVFHPTYSIVYTGLLTGHVKAFSYNDQGSHKQIFSLRPSKRSCRALAINQTGTELYAGGKSRALNIINLATESVRQQAGAHDSPVNRIKYLMPWTLSTGDDDGVIKLWDLRQRESTRSYKQHFDYITDFLWLDDKKHLVATSGDGTLSVMDVRSNKAECIAQSEDQEDELLSIATIKGETKVVVGTQLGILSIFSRIAGWGDCVDRVPGHPHSIDAICALPPSLQNVDTASTILTSSSDGFVRAVQVLPTKLLGVVVDHGSWPVERISIGSGIELCGLDETEVNGDQKERFVKSSNDDDATFQEERKQASKRWWVGSVGHDEVLKLTDLEAFFHERQPADLESVEEDACDWNEGQSETTESVVTRIQSSVREAEDLDSDSDEPEPEPKKRKRKREKNPLAVKKTKGRNTVDAEPSFFGDL